MLKTMKKITFFKPLYRKVHIEIEKKLGNGNFRALITNDLKTNETMEEYIKRSFNEICQFFEKNFFYTFIDKAKYKNGILTAGHISSGMTNNDGKLEKNSFMSLRRGNKILSHYGDLKYELPDKRTGIGTIKNIKFNTFEEEIVEHFLNTAPHEEKSSHVPKKLFLIGVPIENMIEFIQKMEGGQDVKTIEDARTFLVKSIEETKLELKDKPYILYEGKVGDKIFPSRHCVHGYYGQFKLRGEEPNPSPQMGGWSVSNCIFGETELFDNSELKIPNKERTFIDKLKFDKVEEIATNKLTY